MTNTFLIAVIIIVGICIIRRLGHKSVKPINNNDQLEMVFTKMRKVHSTYEAIIPHTIREEFKLEVNEKLNDIRVLEMRDKGSILKLLGLLNKFASYGLSLEEAGSSEKEIRMWWREHWTNRAVQEYELMQSCPRFLRWALRWMLNESMANANLTMADVEKLHQQYQ